MYTCGMSDYHVRNVDPRRLRNIKGAAAMRGMSIGEYLMWLNDNLPPMWSAHATNCGGCGAYIEEHDEDDDGCRAGCPLHAQL